MLYTTTTRAIYIVITASSSSSSNSSSGGGGGAKGAPVVVGLGAGARVAGAWVTRGVVGTASMTYAAGGDKSKEEEENEPRWRKLL